MTDWEPSGIVPRSGGNAVRTFTAEFEDGNTVRLTEYLTLIPSNESRRDGMINKSRMVCIWCLADGSSVRRHRDDHRSFKVDGTDAILVQVD